MRRSPLIRLANRRNLFSTLPIFSFNILNRNCYSTKGDIFERFCLNVRRDDSTDSCFYFTNVCLPVFSVLSFPPMKYSSEIFSFNFSLFLCVLYFCNRFFYLLMMIFPKMVVRRVLVRYKLRIHVRIREKMQNRLRRVLVFDTSERIKKHVFFVHERSVCLSIQVELIFA